MKVMVNETVVDNVSAIEVEGAYEICPEEGLVLKIHLYDMSGNYKQSILIRDIENMNVNIIER